MADRMWTYPELRCVFVNRFRVSSQELALQLNREFHAGEDVRNARDIEKIKRGKNIFNKNKPY